MFRRQLLAAVATLALVVGGTASFSASAAQGNPPVESSPAQADARVAIAHLAPFSETDTSVTITINGAPLPGTASYKDVLPYQNLPAGTYNVAVYAGTDLTAAPAITGTVALEGGKDYTVAAVGDGPNIPLQFLVLEDDNSLPAAGNATIRVIHAAPFAAQASTAVDVLTQPVPLPLGLNNILFGASSDPLSLPAGPVDVEVVSTGTDMQIFDPPALTLTDGAIANVFAIGGANNQPAELFVQAREPRAGAPGNPILNARVAIAHLAPFADTSDPANTAVTVVINDMALPGTISYKNFVPYTTLPPGEYSVQIYVGTDTTATPAIDTTVMLESGKDYTVAAVGDNANVPLQLLVLEDNLTAPVSTDTSVRVVHAAPFAPVPSSAVDILGQPNNVDLNLNNIAFGASTDFRSLPAGPLDVVVVAAGTETVIFDPDALTLPGGAIVTAFAIGDGTNADPELFVLPSAPRAMARLRAAHFAPFTDGPGTVTVLAGPARGPTAPIVQSLSYGEVTDYLDLPEGQYLVEIDVPAPGNAPATVVASATVTLQAGVNYTAVAVGNITDEPVELLLLNDMTVPGAGQGRIRAVHAVPIDAAAIVDVRFDGGATVFDDLAYKATVTSGDLTPGTYDLEVTTADGATVLLDLDPVVLRAGEVITVFVTGDGTNKPIDAFVIDSAGAIQYYLPMIFNAVAGE